MSRCGSAALVTEDLLPLQRQGTVSHNGPDVGAGDYDAAPLKDARGSQQVLVFNRISTDQPQLDVDSTLFLGALSSVKLVIDDFLINGFTDEELEEAREPTVYPALCRLPWHRERRCDADARAR